MAAFILLAEAGPDAGRSFAIPHGETVIGRHADAGIVLGDVQASRRHARLTVQGDEVTISDLGSANGTRVNDAPLTAPRTIRPGDTIALGATTLRLALAADAPHHAPPAPALAQPVAVQERDTAIARPAATAPGATDSAITAGITLNGRYHLDRQIGQGGFARVYVATDLALRRRIAIKVLHAELTDEGAGVDFLDRFAREAQSVAALEHPNILGIYDYGEALGTVYIVMPLVEGGSLHDRLRRDGRPTLTAIATYLRQTAAALDYAHRHHLVHRDLKPQNLLLTTDDRLLLADFGIAKVIGGTGSQSRTGIIGTLSYMAPEQFQGNVVPATDIYALGCVLFQLLTGKLPYDGPTERVMYGHLMDPIPRLAAHRPDLPAALQPLIDRALAKDPAARFPSAGSLAEAFAAASEERPPAPSVHEVATRVAESAPSPQDRTVVNDAPPQSLGARTEIAPARRDEAAQRAWAEAPRRAVAEPDSHQQAATQVADASALPAGWRAASGEPRSAPGQATQVAAFGAPADRPRVQPLNATATRSATATATASRRPLALGIVGALVVALAIGGAIFGLRSRSEKPSIDINAFTPEVAESQYAQVLSLARQQSGDVGLNEFEIYCFNTIAPVTCSATYTVYSRATNRDYRYTFDKPQSNARFAYDSAATLESEKTLLDPLPWRKNGNYLTLATALYPQIPPTSLGGSYSLYLAAGRNRDGEYRGYYSTFTQPLIDNWPVPILSDLVASRHATRVDFVIVGNTIREVSRTDTRRTADLELAKLAAIATFLILAIPLGIAWRRGQRRLSTTA